MVFFSKATTEERRVELVDFLGVSKVREYEKYLGLLAMVGRKKKESLNYIKERVWHKLQGWKEKLLSQVGKEVLLKAVVQEIPTFAMSCFKLPTGLIQDIERLIRKFWWGQQGDQRRIHWKNWETLCQLKALWLQGLGEVQLGYVSKTNVEVTNRPHIVVLQGFSSQVLPKWLGFGCQTFFGVLCLVKHCKSKEACPIRFVVEGWRWKTNKNLWGQMATWGGACQGYLAFK